MSFLPKIQLQMKSKFRIFLESYTFIVIYNIFKILNKKLN